MTRNVNEWYGVTVTHGKKVGPRLWRAEAMVFRRDTQRTVHTVFHGEGAAMTSADRRAGDAAAAYAWSLGKPDDWQPKA